MAVDGIKGEEEKLPILSAKKTPRQSVRPRVTFKKNCKGDFITINVSGRRFEADNSIFERHPGIQRFMNHLFLPTAKSSIF